MWSVRLSDSDREALEMLFYSVLGLDVMAKALYDKSGQKTSRSDLFRMLLYELPKGDLSLVEMQGMALEYASIQRRELLAESLIPDSAQL
jgi:hypothetical protein